MRRRDERGGVALVVAIAFAALLLPVAAIGVDLGMQRVVRRDLQALADLVALDLARELDGRTQAQLASVIDAGNPSSPLSVSVARNDDVLGEPVTVTATLGAWDGTTFDPSADPPSAVRVVAEGEVDFAFATGAGGASRTAYASAENSACFQLSSFAASLDAEAVDVLEDLIQPLLGNSTLTAAGYEGLATADITLADLLRAPSINVGTVNEFLTTGSITAGDLYLAAAHALTGQGMIAGAEVFQKAAVSVIAPITLDMGDLFAMSTASDIVLSTSFNALDLLLGAAFLADGDHLVGLSNLQAGVPSVGVTSTDLTIIERPQRACGDDEAQTAQLELTASAKVSLNAAPLPLGLPLVSLRMKEPDGSPTNELALGLDVDLAGARGKLTSVTCDPDVFTGEIWTDLATARLTGQTKLGGTVKVSLTVGGVNLTGVDVPVSFEVALLADASKPASATPTTVTMTLPPSSYGDHVQVGTGDVILPSLTASIVPGTLQTGPVTVKVLGVDIPIDTSVLDAAVNPVLATVLSPLATFIGATVNPLIDVINEDIKALTTALGINVAGADFYPLAYPACNHPRLIG